MLFFGRTWKICTKSLFPNVRRRATRAARAAAGCASLETPLEASDEVTLCRLFILRVEPSGEGKDIRTYSSISAESSSFVRPLLPFSTQNLDLPGFPTHAGVTRREKSKLSASNPWCRLTSALDSRRFHRSMDIVPFSACPFPPACVPGHGGSSSPGALQYDARCWCISMSQRVHQYGVNLRCMGVCSPRPLDTASSASTLTHSACGLRRTCGLTEQAQRRCTAGATPCLREDPGQED